MKTILIFRKWRKEKWRIMTEMILKSKQMLEMV